MLSRIVVSTCILLAFSASVWAECVDINAAQPDQLVRIVHIDQTRAAEAVDLRAHRPFADVKHLTRIRGVGPSRLIGIEAQGLACVGRETPAGLRPDITGRARVVDGETLEIVDERIRLVGTDAPEGGQKSAPAATALTRPARRPLRSDTPQPARVGPWL